MPLNFEGDGIERLDYGLFYGMPMKTLSGVRVMAGGNARLLSFVHACVRGFQWFLKVTLLVG